MAHWEEGINIMAQALHVEDGSLPQGLTVQNTYMELHKGSKVVAVVVGNSTTYPQMLRKRTQVGHHSYSDTGTHCAEWINEGAGGGPWDSSAQVNHETTAREAVCGIRLQWFGNLATQVGGSCPDSLG